MLEQIDRFLNDKEFVNMSSYKTDAKSGKPIKYLQDTKKALWERFAEEYPNGMHRTSFMTCLEGGQYMYQENLGGLYFTCNDCSYMVFGDIGVIISAHVMDESLKVEGHHYPKFKKCKFPIFLENGGKLWKMLHYAEQFFGIALLQHYPI
ncbi:uncharacterized protein OCT59_014770 [Rhizophagus irregularis]|uniref:Uncharacterized protein n=1 Tax=Rhizophagus irregularis (strain DAOM 197198w) TaxID=1432141 RepID=A0A015IV89_RHIIW|nr:hypothetical protein RirG_200510 [Rhizophagus irregularis DAOM 197198w]UZO22407.1 hypothetical protein OCT59_014770 [Rhizophagus irregularis]GBC44037.2 hypothetical protein GLOIN_2v326913 [Rhizophagus irregularis DAOM 181602=DAOM 197198]